MSYQTLLDDFRSVLNRDDCTEALADTYVRNGILRIQRKVRLPCMEREWATSVLTDDMSILYIPAGLLQIIDVLVQDSYTTYPRALNKLDYRDLLLMDPRAPPTAYARYQNLLKVRGGLAAGSVVSVFYYGAFSELPTFADDNEVTTGFPEVALYAGLSLAADAFAHPSGPAWEARFQDLLNDLAGEAIDIEMHGGPMAVQPLYTEAYS